jgi:hypothetical protein
MKVSISKPDLDTCLTALILGVIESDEIIVTNGEAPEADIMDPSVLCIEAGGSGLVHLGNFDHHDPDKYFPPACRQAYEHSQSAVRKRLSGRVERLVEYVCMVDDRSGTGSNAEFPSLSNIFSGMLLTQRNPVFQFFSGIEILDKVLALNIDPFETMPDIDEWRHYKAAKIENQQRLEEVLKRAEYYNTRSGCKVGFVETGFIGGIGTLYAQGCDVVIMYNSSFGDPPVRKFTIAGNNKKVSHLLEHFDKIEPGWGGRETIIGSPREGTIVEKGDVIAITIKGL